LAKAVAQQGWAADLVCAELKGQVEHDLYDCQLKELYLPYFRDVKPLPDPDFLETPVNSALVQESTFWRRIAVALGRREVVPRPWAQVAVKTTLRRLRFRRRPLLVSFGQPWQSHLVGLKIKQFRRRVRWVASFSDPWADNPYITESCEVPQEVIVQERSVIAAADALVFNTKEAADLVMRKYPFELQEKSHVIPHILDMELLRLIERERYRQTDRLRLLHAGSLYGGQRLSVGLFEALRDLRKRNLVDRDIEIRFIGDIPENVVELVRSYGLVDCVSWITPLFHIPTLREMFAADVLLVMDANFPRSPFLPSKVVDYLMFDKPILGLTPADSATCRFLKGIGYRSVEPNDVRAIRAMILNLLEEWKTQRLKPTTQHVRARHEHDVTQLGAAYIQIFDSLKLQPSLQ